MKTLTVYAPVLIPYQGNCKEGIGESPLTADQIKRFVEQFKDYNLIDKNHSIFDEFKIYGKVIWSSVSEREKTYRVKDSDGVREVTYPEGTWFLEIDITDPETISQIENGELTGLSCSWTTQAVLDLFKKEKDFNKIIAAVNHDIETKEVILDDIQDPVCFCVSLVDRPCFEDCLFIYEWEYSKNNYKTGDIMSKLRKFIMAMNAKSDKDNKDDKGSDSEKIKELEERIDEIEEAVEKIIELIKDEDEDDEDDEDDKASNKKKDEDDEDDEDDKASNKKKDEDDEDDEDNDDSDSDSDKDDEIEELKAEIKELKKQLKEKNKKSKNSFGTKCGKQLKNRSANKNKTSKPLAKSGKTLIYDIMNL